MYLYCLSVNYNNCSLAVGVGNDSQNGIHCCRRVAFCTIGISMYQKCIYPILIFPLHSYPKLLPL